MPYVSEDRHRVRSYELDSYGHVNNAVYQQWLEHGRSKLLQDFGFNYNSIEAAWGVRFVLVSSLVNFRQGLKLEDEVCIRTTVKRLGKSSVTFTQEVEVTSNQQGRILAADAETTIVFTDPSMGGAREIPEEFRRLYG